VTGALITIVAIAVGLPLLAWWVGGRSFWDRLKPGAGHDDWYAFVREHRLTVNEAAEVSSAVARGQALEDPRLRRLAVARAESALARQFPTKRRARWILGALLVAYAVLLVAASTIAGMEGHPAKVPWSSIALVVIFSIGGYVQRRNLRRALARNTDEPEPARTGTDRPGETGPSDT
jgi:protein-S-isoprenylcysteine O-methyltransferase Ste14